jgi:aspartate kinase
MSLIVQKYGGTSVGTIDRILNVAQRVIATKKQGHDVVVVLSAMAGETNRLLDLAYQISKEPSHRELDQLVATGEQVTIALLSLALQKLGQPARSLLGSQVKIVTDRAHSKARIQSIDAENIFTAIKAGEVVVVAGFQGMTPEGDVTTLGRGGSDTTAVAIAAAIKADLCEIYTDVDGVYTTDPRICANARKLPKIAYEEMLEMASLGAKVLQIRSVEFAAKYKVNLVVRSSFNDNDGTLVTHEDKSMEDVVVSGITLSDAEAKIALRHVPDRPGIAMQVFGAIAEANVNVDMIVQNTSADGKTDLTFTMPVGDLDAALRVIEKLKDKVGFTKIDTDREIAKVSIVGVGMRSHAGVAAKMFELLAKSSVNIQMISTSEIKVSVVVAKDQGKAAVKILHDGFGLGS